MNPTKRIFVLTLVLATLGFAGPEKVEKHLYQIRADGLNCLFCAYTVEKLVGRVDGVDKETFDIDLKTGVISVASLASAYASPRMLRKALDESGFTYKSMKVEMIGRVEKMKSGLEFHPQFGKEIYKLQGNGSSLDKIEPDQTIHIRGSVDVEPLTSQGKENSSKPLNLKVEKVTSAEVSEG